MIILDFQEEIKAVQNGFEELKDQDNILIFSPNCSFLLKETRQFLRNYNFKKDTKLKIVLNNKEYVNYIKDFYDRFDFEYEYWNTWHLFELINNILEKRQIYTPKNYEKAFTSLNHRARKERCMFLDKLAKYDLVNDNFVTWHLSDCNYSFKYFDNKARTIEETIYLHNVPEALPFPYPSAPKEAFENSLWSVVSEFTLDDNPNFLASVTEKTYLPILHKRPFLTLGCVNLTRKLVDLGFRLYDNYINYDYDSLEDFEDRLDKFVIEVKKINNSDHQKIHNMLRDDIEFNYNHAKNLVMNKIKNENNTRLSSQELNYMKQIILQKTDYFNLDHLLN